MKRVFSSVIYEGYKRSAFFSNDFISEIYEGIHNQGGEVLTMQLSLTLKNRISGEHLLITYEDNGHYDEINKILKDKKDHFTKYI